MQWGFLWKVPKHMILAVGNTVKDGEGYCEQVFHAFTNSLACLPSLSAAFRIIWCNSQDKFHAILSRLYPPMLPHGNLQAGLCLSCYLPLHIWPSKVLSVYSTCWNQLEHQGHSSLKNQTVQILMGRHCNKDAWSERPLLNTFSPTRFALQMQEVKIKSANC